MQLDQRLQVAVLRSEVRQQAVVGGEDETIEGSLREQTAQTQPDDFFLIGSAQGHRGHGRFGVIGQISGFDVHFRPGNRSGEGENLEGAGGVKAVEIQGEGRAGSQGQVSAPGLIGDPGDGASAVGAHDHDGIIVAAIVVVRLSVLMRKEMGDQVEGESGTKPDSGRAD